MAAQTDSVLPFILRLSSIEAKIVGTQHYPGTEHRNDYPEKLGESSKTALRRVQGINEALERLGGENEGLRRFVENCKSGWTALQ